MKSPPSKWTSAFVQAPAMAQRGLTGTEEQSSVKVAGVAVGRVSIADDQGRCLNGIEEVGLEAVFPVVVEDHLVVGRGRRGHDGVHPVRELGATLAVLDLVHHVPGVLLVAEDEGLLVAGGDGLGGRRGDPDCKNSRGAEGRQEVSFRDTTFRCLPATHLCSQPHPQHLQSFEDQPLPSPSSLPRRTRPYRGLSKRHAAIPRRPENRARGLRADNSVG